MKKIVLLLLSAVMCLTLAGCKDAVANVSNPKETILKVGKTTITKADLYQSMLADDSANTVINKALEMIANAEIETTDEIKEEAQATYDDYQQQIESMGSDFEETIKGYGFPTLEDFMNWCITQAKTAKLADNYIEEQWTALVEENKPVKAKMIFVDGSAGLDEALADAKAALEKIKAGSSFDDVSAEYSDRASLATETLYVRSDSSLDYNVLQFLLAATSPTLSDVITNKDTTGYYIVQVTNTNVEQIKDDFITKLKAGTDFTETVNKSYFQKHNFRIYDIDLYNTVKSVYPNYLVQD